jgi:5-hydroxyisourate hydrolase
VLQAASGWPPAAPRDKMRGVISTHVLDTERGAPAVGVRVELYRGPERVAEAETDGDGRVRALAEVDPGPYRLVFHPPSPFFRRVEVEVEIEAGRDHHVPLLLSPYQCTIYRGS